MKFYTYEKMFLSRKYNLAALMPFRAWYVDGRVLVVIVTFGIILPLCLLKNLGKERACFYHTLYSAPMNQKPNKMNNFAFYFYMYGEDEVSDNYKY